MKSLRQPSHLCSAFDKYGSKEGLKNAALCLFISPLPCILSFNDQNVMKHVLAVYLKADCAACAHKISVTYRVRELSPQQYISGEALKFQNGWGLVLTIRLQA